MTVSSRDFFAKFTTVMGESAAPAAGQAAAATEAAAEEELFNPLWIVGGTLLVMVIIVSVGGTFSVGCRRRVSHIYRG